VKRSTRREARTEAEMLVRLSGRKEIPVLSAL
jgi:hypothetical protein